METRSRRKGTSASIDAQAKRLNEQLCISGAVKKCDECGCTLKSEMDVTLHYCDRFGTMTKKRSGDVFDRCFIG